VITRARTPVTVVIVSFRGDIEEPSSIGLSLWLMPDGEAVVYLGGELDIVSAEVAFAYVRDVIDRCRGPVVVDLSALHYCDAHGLRALSRLCDYAERSGTVFQLASPRESLVKVTQITGLDMKLFPRPRCMPCR
jgi:anti-anti-sigma factor